MYTDWSLSRGTRVPGYNTCTSCDLKLNLFSELLTFPDHILKKGITFEPPALDCCDLCFVLFCQCFVFVPCKLQSSQLSQTLYPGYPYRATHTVVQLLSLSLSTNFTRILLLLGDLDRYDGTPGTRVFFCTNSALVCR